MKIAITGTRGIPNQYGGFEQFAMQLAISLVASGHKIIVYNPYGISYKDSTYEGVEIIRKRLPERLMGAASNYLYDFACLRDAIRRKVDVILECGYASAAPWYPVLRRGGIKLVTHMDGMEWQREKWNGFTRKIIRRAEAMAVRYSDALVCDHPEVADYYREAYSVSPEIIPYGAEILEDWDADELRDLEVKPGTYYLLVARLEPENNIRMIIEGFLASGAGEFLVVVGDHCGKYGRLISKEFGNNRKLRFMGGVFDQKRLDHLRHYSRAVFHGHSVGGTNPSLLEAMAAGAFIIAHDNVYNKWVLGDNASYFQSKQELSDLLIKIDETKRSAETVISNNLARIRAEFQWDSVVSKYEKLFTRLVGLPD